MTIEKFCTIRVEGMSCQHCEANVTQSLLKLDGIEDVIADRISSQVRLRGSKINLYEIEPVISGLGYTYKGIVE